MKDQPTTGDRRQPAAQQIRDAALALFAEHGYEATTLGQIANRVGLKKPSLYNHIQSKEALFVELVDAVEASFFVVLDASLAQTRGAALEARLWQLVQDLGAFIARAPHGAFYQRCLLFPPSELRATVRAVNARSERRIDAALDDLFQQGASENAWRDLDRRTFVDAFYCFMDGLYAERFVYSQSEHERRIRSAWRVFRAGVLA